NRGGATYGTWSWQEADVRSVFAQISNISGSDIVVDPNVSGKVSVRLSNKQWQQAFNIVCRMLNLAAIEENDYIYVLNQKDFQDRQIERATTAVAVQDASPLVREIISLNNTKASELIDPVRELLSPRGKVTIIDHNNALIVYDTDMNIAQIKGLIDQLDIETKQIAIAAKIVEVNTSKFHNIGIQWGIFGSVENQPASAIHLPGDEDGNIISNAIDKLSWGILDQDRYSVTMEYLFRDNDGEIVAQPSITTLDNKEASIFMGENIPTIVLDEAGNSITRYVPAGTKLTVVPHVTDSNRIMMQIQAQKETPDQSGSIRSQKAHTNVVVSDGQTVVIAGLTSTQERKEEEGIPFLKNIPILGHLFKRSNNTDTKADLLIFVTPKIVGKSRSVAIESADESAGDSVQVNDEEW
ncbi:MAG: secretin N-terminal domain-containing protein, partial [Chitinispirillaceae bacterium]